MVVYRPSPSASMFFDRPPPSASIFIDRPSDLASIFVDRLWVPTIVDYPSSASIVVDSRPSSTVHRSSQAPGSDTN
ncbi:hypothetical protein M5K25_010346 [Dendrobium thyrsiflorum]|uniref:Uncharacterized protein n=1 Tax=Dendrobium thyrsiflorum TaxID=117978 RepID=A0ABD0V6G1_DENTH